MTGQAQIRRPGLNALSRTGDRGPSQAEIPQARAVGGRDAGVRGPEGRSRMDEVEAE